MDGIETNWAETTVAMFIKDRRVREEFLSTSQ